MKTAGRVVKLSASDIQVSVKFYMEIMGFTVDDRYTLNTGGAWGTFSYVQLNMPGLADNIAVGLFKDIDKPFPAGDPSTVPGTAPTFMVTDIESVRNSLMEQKVNVGEIISNTSDAGYTDHFAFFRDPDNNTLVIRQNM
jgi:catechol 2,3-dioxygenase-like lactoylglutathione lyase family enzyme